MGLFDSLFRKTEVDPENYEPPSGIPEPGGDYDLVLYKFNTCPYCRRVLNVVRDLEVDVEFRDTHTDPGAREELREETGRTTVPCLFIDGTPFFESRDINAWLQVHDARQAA
ncbi:MAG: glutaredoxin family protein [Myxococcota bacterium]